MLREYPHLFTQSFLIFSKFAEILTYEICKFPINVFPHGKKKMKPVYKVCSF